MVSIIRESKSSKLIETEYLWLVGCDGGWRNGEIGQSIQTSNKMINNFGYLMYSTVIIVNKTVLYTLNLLSD